jgi:hypothetical protein
MRLLSEPSLNKFFHGCFVPHASIPHGRIGYQSPDMFEDSAFRRAPTPKIRMQVFTRDRRKCRICGRRPDDNSDLVLHVHHVRPWEKGGVTDPSNLITLCHTCHAGLDPHDDPSLFEYISSARSPTGQRLLDFSREVANYRKVGFLGAADEVEGTNRRRRRRPVRQLKWTSSRRAD